MIMAALGSEVAGSWFLSSSGVVGFFILLLLLSIFLTALCSDCGRRSFDLRDPVDRNPSSLIRVVKLEEALGARENPMINEIQNDEKGDAASFTPWRNHLGAPQNHQVAQTNGSTAVIKTTGGSETSGDENPVSFTPWRSHLGAPQSQGLNSSAPQEHIYSVIGGERGDADTSSPPSNQEPGEERSARSGAALDLNDRNSMYARVSRKERQATPPVHTPKEMKVEEEEEEEESPPLPDRRTQLEG
ncbi:uncharacterized protein LOC115580839 [Sparus aurata]|uniref:uncharacterized protein LOC115580839 n=1 Tax=Sparus aurata TaxID=8175 RepID=UPI0011C1B14E|nr:uncharacterized protein LOC115580839 [Sparus aurata]